MNVKVKPLVLALLALGSSHWVQAQQASGETGGKVEKLERVEVLGSRIKRTDKETIAPVEVITHQAIVQSGKATVAEVLRGITANSGQSYGESNTNSFAAGSAGISLRGLGQKSTLVLVNGRRVANYGFALGLSDTFTDLNSIPSAAIERVEILKDGASALYGSDAIAGVVNIVLRQDFTGAEINTDFGQSTYHDQNEKHAAVTGGYGDFDEQGFNILASLDLFKRGELKYSQRPYTRDMDTRNYPGGSLGWSANAGTYRTSPRTPFATCLGPGQKMAGSLFGTTGTVCGYNPAGYLDIMPETERTNLFTHGRYKLGSSTELYGELFASHNETHQSFTPTPISNTGVRYDPTTGGVAIVDSALPVGNPSNPYSTATRTGYTFFDVGPRSSKIVSDSTRALVGAKGQVNGWDWDSAAGVSENKVTQTNYNRVNAIALQQMIANGTYDFLSPTQAQTDALRLNFDRKAKTRLFLADTKVSGEFGKLPGGAIGLAVGVDARRETLVDRPADVLAQGYVLGQGATQNDAARNAGAAFTELSLPVLKSVELSLAGREDKYSDFGSAFSPKVGVKFKPIEELAFRSSWGKGFRAPTLAENSKGTSTYFTTVTDPNDGKSYSIAGVLKGNPDLQPEKSKSLNFGIVAQPADFVDFTIDYYQIRQNKLVMSDDPQYLVDNEATNSKLVVRDPSTGQLQYVVTSYRNLEYVKTRGIDLSSNWRLGRIGDGALSAHAEWTYLLSWKTPPAEGEAAEEYAGSNAYGSAFPRNRGKVSLGWKNASLSTALTTNFKGGYYQEVITSAQKRVDSFLTTDLFVGYKFGNNWETTFSVQNIENKKPPFDANYTSYGGLNYNEYSGTDRYFRLGLTYRL